MLKAGVRLAKLDSLSEDEASEQTVRASQKKKQIQNNAKLKHLRMRVHVDDLPVDQSHLSEVFMNVNLNIFFKLGFKISSLFIHLSQSVSDAPNI